MEEGKEDEGIGRKDRRKEGRRKLKETEEGRE